MAEKDNSSSTKGSAPFNKPRSPEYYVIDEEDGVINDLEPRTPAAATTDVSNIGLGTTEENKLAPSSSSPSKQIASSTESPTSNLPAQLAQQTNKPSFIVWKLPNTTSKKPLASEVKNQTTSDSPSASGHLLSELDKLIEAGRLRAKEDRDEFARQMKEERRVLERVLSAFERRTTTILDNTETFINSKEGSIINKIGGLFEVIAQDLLPEIVVKHFRDLKLQGFENRTYSKANKYFSDACSKTGEILRNVEIDLISYGYSTAREDPAPRINNSPFKQGKGAMNCVLFAEVTTSSLKDDDDKLFEKLKQLDLRVRFIEAYYDSPVHSVYLVTLHGCQSFRNYSSFLKDYKFTRLLELFREGRLFIYTD